MTSSQAQAGARRIAAQIAADGQQARELARTRSYHYSVFNLIAMCLLADLGAASGVDVWTASAPRLRAAIDLILPHGDGTTTWPHAELEDVDYGAELAHVLVRAARAYPEAGYARAVARIAAKQSALGALKLRLNLFGSLGGTASAPPPWAA